MTGPIVNVNPDDLRQTAQGWRAVSTDFISESPPEVNGDWPSHGATQRFHGAVAGTGKDFHDKLNGNADGVDGAANGYQSTDDANAGRVKGVGGGQAGAVAKGLDAQGFGTIMNAFLGPLGQIASGVAQGANQLFSGTVQGVGQIAGQMVNAGGSMASKNMGVTAHADPGVGGAVGAGAGGSGGGSAGSAPVRPASGVGPPSPMARDGEHNDRYEHSVMTTGPEVQPAGMAGGMPMGMGGLGSALGGQGGGSSSKPKTYQVSTGNQQDDPDTEPIPVITEVAFAPSALKKQEEA